MKQRKSGSFGIKTDAFGCFWHFPGIPGKNQSDGCSFGILSENPKTLVSNIQRAVPGTRWVCPGRVPARVHSPGYTPPSRVHHAASSRYPVLAPRRRRAVVPGSVAWSGPFPHSTPRRSTATNWALLRGQQRRFLRDRDNAPRRVIGCDWIRFGDHGGLHSRALVP